LLFIGFLTPAFHNMAKSYLLTDCVQPQYGYQRLSVTDQILSEYCTVMHVCVCGLWRVDSWFRRCLPSLVCAASIATARHCLRISPTWLNRLHHRTGYSWTELQPLMTLMIQSVHYYYYYYCESKNTGHYSFPLLQQLLTNF